MQQFVLGTYPEMVMYLLHYFDCVRSLKTLVFNCISSPCFFLLQYLSSPISHAHVSREHSHVHRLPQSQTICFCQYTYMFWPLPSQTNSSGVRIWPFRHAVDKINGSCKGTIQSPCRLSAHRCVFGVSLMYVESLVFCLFYLCARWFVRSPIINTPTVIQLHDLSVLKATNGALFWILY